FRCGSVDFDPSVAKMLHAAVRGRDGYFPAGVRICFAKDIAIASNEVDGGGLGTHDFLPPTIPIHEICVAPSGACRVFLTYPALTGYPYVAPCGAAHFSLGHPLCPRKLANCYLPIALPKIQLSRLTAADAWLERWISVRNSLCRRWQRAHSSSPC